MTGISMMWKLERAKTYERRFRHDVMAHIHAFWTRHLRATFLILAHQRYVTDNADLIILRDAMAFSWDGSWRAAALRSFAQRYRDLPDAGLHPFPTGSAHDGRKGARPSAQDFAMDAARTRSGATLPCAVAGNDGNRRRVSSSCSMAITARSRRLDRRIAAAFRIRGSIPVSGQTYTRKIDSRVLDLFAGIRGIRLEVRHRSPAAAARGRSAEPARTNRSGPAPCRTSATRCVRADVSLARYVFGVAENTPTPRLRKWLERTLDRFRQPASRASRWLSRHRRRADLADQRRCRARGARAAIGECSSRSCHSWPRAVLMLAVGAGGDRQALHEVIRRTVAR